MKQITSFEYIRDILDFITLSEPNSKNTIDSHFHEAIEVLYVTKGSVLVEINGDKRILHEDQLLFCDSFDLHSFETPTDEDLSISFIIPPSLLMEYKAIKKSHRLRSNFILDKKTALSFKSLLDTLALFHTPGKMNSVSANIAKAFLSLIVTAVGFQDNKHQSTTFSSEVLQYISDHLSEFVTLDGVAAHFGYTKYYFTKIFQNTFHVTFGYYLNLLRMQKAIQLIKAGNSSLNAAIQAGFNSESTFYRFIRNEFNMTPAQLIHYSSRES